MVLEATAAQASRGPELLLQALGLSQQEIQQRRNEMLSRDNLIAQFLTQGLRDYGGIKEREEDVAFREEQTEYQKTRDTKSDTFRDRELVMAEAQAEIDVALKSNNLKQAELILKDLPARLQRAASGEGATIAATEAGTAATLGAEERAVALADPQRRSAEAGARVAEAEADVADRSVSNRLVLSDLELEEARRAGRVGKATEQSQIDVGNLQPTVLSAQLKAYEAAAAADLAKASGTGVPNKFDESFAKFVETVSDRVDKNYSAAIGNIMDTIDVAITPEMKNQAILKVAEDRNFEKSVIAEFEAHGREVQKLINAGYDPYVVWRLFKADTMEGGLGTFDWTLGGVPGPEAATDALADDIEKEILDAAQNLAPEEQER